MPDGNIFAKGVIANSPEGLFMTSDPEYQGRPLLWLAKRGNGYHDWAIYVHWAENGEDFVRTNGDKVSIHNIQKLVDCDDAALSMYRK